jgi:hypothetical protein
MRGATAGTAGVSGYAPAPAAGDQDKQLHGDGSYRASTSASAASTAEAIAETETSKWLSPATGAAQIALTSNARAPRGGIVSAGTSAVGTTQDNPGLAFGTNDLTIGMWVRLPDWTPSADTRLLWKTTANLGVTLRLSQTGILYLQIGNGSTQIAYSATVTNGLADAAWGFLTATLDRDGNLTWYVNAVQLGNPVAVSAQAAQTLTSAAALNWFSDGSTHTAGTIGECWIISGLLSASRIADIYRAGSIAPFCTMTANATTGQNTATIDGLSFYTWPEFDQGYGPIIRDRSGNNQHALMGTSGLFHAVRKNPPGVPQRAPRTALVYDNSASAKVLATLNTQNPGSGDLTLWSDEVVVTGSTNVAGTHAIALTPSTDGSNFAAGAMYLAYTDRPYVVLRGATANDRRQKDFPAALYSVLAGRRCVWGIVKATTGVRILLGLDGDLFDVTNLATESTVGNPPAWTDAVSGTFLSPIFPSTVAVGPRTIYDTRIANVAMTEAQLRAEYERGEPGPEWIGASKVNLFAGWTFLSGWTALSATVVDADTFTTAGAGGVIWSGLQKGSRYRLTSAWSTTASSFDIRDYVTGIVLLTASGSTVEFVAQSSQLYFRNGGAGTTDVSSLTLERLGWTTRLRTDSGGGYQARNDARSATNDATNFDLSTTGITWSPEAPVGARVSIVGTKLHSEISATGGTTVFGVRPAGWRVVEYQQNQDVAFDTGLTLDLGTVATPALFVSGLALDATGFKQADSLSKTPSSLTATQTIYGKKSGGTTTGNILRYTIVLERIF